MRPPLVSRKLIPLAQSSELPPPRPMIESMFKWRSKLASRFNHSRVRIDFEIVKAKDFDSGLSQRRDCFVDVTRRNQTTIGDQQRPLKLQFARQLAETFNRAGAKDHASRG